ncbi:MAG: hypothetical protein HQL21_00590 [Candidatus Omnitrophica bacterium]|nr:hypothetical protein [Candidatus Omnitrophota bacterium]
MTQPQVNQRQKDIARLLREKRTNMSQQLKNRGSFKAAFANRKMGGR